VGGLFKSSMSGNKVWQAVKKPLSPVPSNRQPAPQPDHNHQPAAALHRTPPPAHLLDEAHAPQVHVLARVRLQYVVVVDRFGADDGVGDQLRAAPVGGRVLEVEGGLGGVGSGVGLGVLDAVGLEKCRLKVF